MDKQLLNIKDVVPVSFIDSDRKIHLEYRI